MKDKGQTTPLVGIILCHYNGKDYIEDQIRSILNQSYPNIHIEIFDDASTCEESKQLLENNYRDERRISLHWGEKNIGFSDNFLFGVKACYEKYDYISFSDQDDIWHNDKIERSLAKLQSNDECQPAMYCSSTEIINHDATKLLGHSPHFPKPPSFGNALVQNIGGGNTMIINGAASKMLVNCTKTTQLPSHDWWVYLVTTATGGRVYYDHAPTLKYRQHDANIIGSNANLLARVNRIARLFRGDFHRWSQKHIEALELCSDMLTEGNLRLLQSFKIARSANIFARLTFAVRPKVYRQTRFGSLALIIAFIVKKI